MGWRTIAFFVVMLVGCSKGTPRSSFTPELAVTLRDLFASADSVIAFDVESSLTSEKEADWSRSGRPSLLGSMALDSHPPAAFVVGYLAKSHGRRLSTTAIRMCEGLLADPRAHECRGELSTFSPALALEIYRGTSRAECMVESDGKRWLLGYGTGRCGGDFSRMKAPLQELIREVFPDDVHYQRLFGA